MIGPPVASSASVYCQACGASNAEEAEFCRLCHQRLLVVSGTTAERESFEDAEESFSFDEHLLERISILEEAVKRTAETVRQLLGALRKHERSLLVSHTGIESVRELLEQKGVLGHDEWSQSWQSKMDYQLLALEKRERFTSIKERIAALYRGDRRKAFIELLEDAEYALFASDIERAVGALIEAFKLDRANYELAYFLGEIYFNEADPQTALEYFARVLEVKPDHYEGLVFSGVIHNERGDHGRAEEFLKRAVALYPDSFLPNFSLGAVYAAEGELSKAVVFLDKATAVDPVPQAQFMLGRCLYEMGRLSGAIKALREAVRLDPSFEEAHHLLGLAYLDRRWNQRALESFRAAQRLNPKKLKYQDLVSYLSGQLAAPLPRVGKETARLLREGERHVAKRSFQRALASYRRALALEPDHPTVLMAYALVCLHLDRSEEIESVTRKVLEGSPGEMLKATAYAMLIASLRSQGKYREGNRSAERLLAEERSGFAQAIGCYEMAYNLAEMEEDLDLALDYARRSLEMAPEELRQFPLAALGWVHYKRREYRQAVDFLARSSALAVSPTTLTHLGMALLAAGDEEDAKTVLLEARGLSERGEAIEERMMTFMKDSGQLLERVHSSKR